MEEKGPGGGEDKSRGGGEEKGRGGREEKGSGLPEVRVGEKLDDEDEEADVFFSLDDASATISVAGEAGDSAALVAAIHRSEIILDLGFGSSSLHMESFDYLR